MHLSRFHFSHSGWTVLPLLGLCQLYSQHQRLPVVWRQEVHLCVQQLQLCECYSRGRKSSFPARVEFTMCQPTFCIFCSKFWNRLVINLKYGTLTPLYSPFFCAVECEVLPWVSGEEWAGVHQACKLQELLTESQLSVGPESVTVSRFTRWDNETHLPTGRQKKDDVVLFFHFLPKVFRKFQIQNILWYSMFAQDFRTLNLYFSVLSLDLEDQQRYFAFSVYKCYIYSTANRKRQTSSSLSP